MGQRDGRTLYASGAPRPIPSRLIFIPKSRIQQSAGSPTATFSPVCAPRP